VAAILAASALVGSALLFLVEPMTARALLPGFGGSAAVWNTCLVFFQGLLLAGYAWSHFGVRWLGTRRQMAAQTTLVLVALAFVLWRPVLAQGQAPALGWPVPALLASLAVATGPAFFALSTNSTVVQHWAAAAGREPWWLYAAGNAGSLAALAAYPLLVEPRLGLRAQEAAWKAGFAIFAALTMAAILAVRRRIPADTPVREPAQDAGAAQIARWVLRPLVASALLQSTTLVLANEVASMPLLWAAALGLYLLSWVLAFAPRVPYPRAFLEIVAGLGIAGGLSLAARLSYEARPAIALMLATLLAGCWICHADLVRDRPAASGLTGFYLWTSAGGFAGALLCNVVAPRVFDGIAEFPLSLAALAAMLALGPGAGGGLRAALRTRAVRWRLAITAVLLSASVALARAQPQGGWSNLPAALVGLAAVWRAPAQLPVAAAAVAVLVASDAVGADASLRERRRSFYGELRVMDAGDWRILAHGTTTHGVQLVDPPARWPAAYYHPQAPLGALVAAQSAGARIGLVGMGAGALAALTRTGQEATFFELDPEVEPLARRHFTFLTQARAPPRIVVGDARRTLESVAPGTFDLLVLDAFSGDAVPVHLLTREAVALCAERLAPEGILAVHISNRYFDLGPVLVGAARALGLQARGNDFTASPEQRRQGVMSLSVVALSRTAAALARLPGDGWQSIGGTEVEWTDDRSSLLDVWAGP